MTFAADAEAAEYAARARGLVIGMQLRLMHPGILSDLRI
jgi:hypothetical protein